MFPRETSEAAITTSQTINLSAEPLLIGMIEDPLRWSKWPEAQSFLHDAMLRSDLGWPQIEIALSNGTQQLWAVLEGDNLIGAAVTQVITTRSGNVAEVHLVAGRDFRHWIGGLSRTIEDAAREFGCISLRASGRFGWKDTLQEIGWLTTAMVYERSLHSEAA